ncbi:MULTISPECIES: YaeQ family protein [unclassified Pseudoalteromonas]|uniref:YaeQ family protein n=1 Tax=unclassified Pseudoalteromonas TaxID=194690 RepID=UPI000CF5E94D|nr:MULTISPECIES: YaeQ family protein [unclassified Pseudoalteromonas]
MALKATIIKARLNISDMNRHHYQEYPLTVAQHPSETEQRLMIRLLAFALHANDELQFTKGLCAEDEPELWQREMDDSISLWIDLGLPDEKRLKKACTRAQEVVLYAYGENNQEIWWQKNQQKLSQFKNLRVISLNYEQTQQLAAMASRSVDLTISIEDAEVWVSNQEQTLQITLTSWQGQG